MLCGKNIQTEYELWPNFLNFLNAHLPGNLKLNNLDINSHFF